MSYRLSHTRTYPIDVATAYDVVLPMPLAELFSRRHLLIPPIREVRDQVGIWGEAAGQTRTVVLTDGGTMRETLLTVDRPAAFTYQLTDVTGPLRPLAQEIHGQWAFDPAGTGVRITWTWDVKPNGRLGRVAERPFRAMHAGYARLAFEHLETVLVPST